MCVNLYPFANVVARHGVTEEEAVEMIDVGGPSMLRGAAKNFRYVAAVSRPEQYEPVLRELRKTGEVSLDTRRRLAADAFAVTAAYEATIAQWFAATEAFPQTVTLALEKVLDLAYGENPHQRAAYYRERGARTHLLSRVEQLHGKDLSFNNLNDLSAARLAVREFALPACVIVKHANPCGVAIAATIDEAYERALASDPVAAYEAGIAAWFGEREHFPEMLVVPLAKVTELAYGENPHQHAAYYAEVGTRRHLLSRVEQLHGKELSFNNLNDLSSARSSWRAAAPRRTSRISACGRPAWTASPTCPSCSAGA